MVYDIMVRDRDGSVERLDSADSYDDAQRKRVAFQRKVKPRFVYLKKC